MKKLILLLSLACIVTSCNVTESIVFNDSQSGKYVITYEMGDVLKAVEESFGGDQNGDEKKEQGELLDSTLVFAELMETYNDSIAALPHEKQAALEAVKDMFVNMKVNEDEGVMNISIGMEFNSIEELSNIQEKIEKVKSLDDRNREIDDMIANSPLGNLTSADDAKVSYFMNSNSFSRSTKVSVSEAEMKDMESLFETSEGQDQEFMDFFKESVFKLEYTFPKAVKSISVEDAEISGDRKKVTYKVNWVDYLKNPLLLDMNVIFEDE